MRKTIAIAAALAAWGMAGSALADPYYVKLGDIKGESTDRAHKDWIVIESLSLAKTTGGAKVSSDDLSNDDKSPKSRATATIAGSPASHAGHEVTHSMQQGAGKPKASRRVAAPPPDPVPAALLLPAVQKVRSAHLKRSAWPGCRKGQNPGVVEIRDGANGRTGRILDTTVEQCASESVSLNFSKIEW